jgi:hypothetical protein
MLHYERFEETVLKEQGSDGAEWKHLLPSIPIAHRLRFLYTLRKGFSVVASYDMVMLSQTLAEKEYSQFVQQAIATKLSENNPGHGMVGNAAH